MKNERAKSKRKQLNRGGGQNNSSPRLVLLSFIVNELQLRAAACRVETNLIMLDLPSESYDEPVVHFWHKTISALSFKF